MMKKTARLTGAWAAPVLLAGLGFIIAGCVANNTDSSTAQITITGIPRTPGSAVTYLILEAGGSGGAATLNGNLNPLPQGIYVPWTMIDQGIAAMDLYEGKEFIAYLSALRYGYTPPPIPARRPISGSGTVMITYADEISIADPANGNNPVKKRTWGIPRHLKFSGDLILRWEDGWTTEP